MSGVFPPLQEVTPDNKGPAVVVVGYALVLTSILFTAIRAATTVILKRGFGFEDAFILTSTTLALAQTILAERAVDHGLGRRMATLTHDELTSYYKFQYANHILSIVVMACAKISVILLIQRLSPARSSLRRACYAVGGSILVWLIFSVFALAFQCGTPNPWIYTPQRCAGRGAVWFPIVVFNILTDAVLAILFVPVLWKLQMLRSRQMTVVSLFGTRIFACVAEVAQLVLLPPALHASDQTWLGVNAQILVQVVMNVSIITANIPSLNRFLSELQTGQNGTRIPDPSRYGYNLSDQAGGASSKKKSKDKSNGSDRKPRSTPSSRIRSANDPSFTPDTGTVLSSRIFADNKGSGNGGVGKGGARKKNSGGENSVNSMTKNGVMQSWEFRQEVENGSPGGSSPGDQQHANGNVRG